MKKVKVGDKFERLLVLELIANKKNPKAKCQCDCGNICFPQRGALKNGKAKSCGCKRLEMLRTANIKHGKSNERVYKIWAGIKDRCTNPKNKYYKNYGGIGIKNNYKNFEEFVADVGIPKKGFWIERLDNSKGYEVGNCKWVIPTVNQENKRISKYWTIDGVTYESSTKAALALGVNVSVVIRGCNGYTKKGKVFLPKKGWYCSLKYGA